MSAAAARGSCTVLQMATCPPAPRAHSPGPHGRRGPAHACASELSTSLLSVQVPPVPQVQVCAVLGVSV